VVNLSTIAYWPLPADFNTTVDGFTLISGKVSAQTKPEDLPDHVKIILLSGERRRFKNLTVFISHFSGSSHKKFFNMKKKIFIVAAIFFSSQLFAQKDSVVINEEFPTTSIELLRVIVTANKYPQKQSQTGKVVTVISEEIIERSKGKTISELLDQQAGIVVVGAGNDPGTNQDVYLRGAAVGKTLILLDGIPYYDASSISTAFDLNTINLENVERIEIVKGAQSTLYGSDAVAGVINIITRKNGKKSISPYATLAVGSYNTYKTVAGFNGKQKSTDYNFQWMHLGSKGFSSAFDSSGKGDFDKDAYHQNTINGSVGIMPSGKTKLRFYGQWSKYKTELDASAFTDENDYTADVVNWAAGVNGSWNYKKGTAYFNYNYNNMDRKYLNDSLDRAGFADYTREHYIGRSHFIEAYSKYEINDIIELLSGADFRSQNMDQDFFSTSLFGPYQTKINHDSAKSNQLGIFSSLLFQNREGLYVELGGRFNHHSEYGSNFTYTFNPAYLIKSKVKLFANISSGFKAPSPYQLFAPSFGNQKLKAEKANTIEGGIQFIPGKQFTARAVYFNRDVKNAIDYNFSTNQYFNYNEQKDHGFELEADYRPGKFLINAHYTYIKGKVSTLKYQFNPMTFGYDVKGDTTFNNLFRRPEHSAFVSVGLYATANLFLSTAAKWTGKRFESVFGSSPVVLDSYYTIDLYADYKFKKWVKLFLDLRNITDQKYFDILGYNSKRFNFTGGFSFSL
jgi:vitamin B12 transporter